MENLKGKIDMKIFLIAAICLYMAFNIVTSKVLDAKQMKTRYIDGQCVVGKITVTIFYLPAWLLKGLRFIINALVK